MAHLKGKTGLNRRARHCWTAGDSQGGYQVQRLSGGVGPYKELAVVLQRKKIVTKIKKGLATSLLRVEGEPTDTGKHKSNEEEKAVESHTGMRTNPGEEERKEGASSHFKKASGVEKRKK